jgi:phage/plasmid-associated DNA primase
LTGGDTVTGRGMRENFSTFRPTAKLWIIGNHRPIVTDQDESPWRRIRVVPVERTIPEKERDPELAQKLRAELPGILAWGIRGCVAWQRERLGQSARVQTATGAYRLDSDVLAPFVSERCMIGPQLVVTRAGLYHSYVEWSETQHTRPLSDRAFAEAVRGRKVEDCQIRANGKPARAWRGIGLAEYTEYTRQGVFPVNGLEESHKDLTGNQSGMCIQCTQPTSPADAPSAAGVLGNCTRVRPGSAVTPADVEALQAHLAGLNGTAQATLDKLWVYWKAAPAPSVSEFLAAERKRALHA